MNESQDEKITCRTPTPGKQPTRIERWKFEAVRQAILDLLPASGTGVLFKELPAMVASHLDPELRDRLGSVAWYTTTVKLHLETTGEIQRISRSSPQRLLRARSDKKS